MLAPKVERSDPLKPFMTRTASAQVTSMVLATWFHISSCLLGLAFLSSGLQPLVVPSDSQLVLLFAVSATSFAGQLSLNYSYQGAAPASPASSRTITVTKVWPQLHRPAFNQVQLPRCGPSFAGQLSLKCTYQGAAPASPASSRSIKVTKVRPQLRRPALAQ